MDVAKRLGQVLRDFRKLEGTLQGEVARQAGYKNQSPLSKIERAKKRALFEEVWAFRELLNFSLEDLERGMNAHEAGNGDAWLEELRRRRRMTEGGTSSAPGSASHGLGEDRLDFLGREVATEDLSPVDRRLIADMYRGFAAFLRFLVRMRSGGRNDPPN